MAELAQDDGVGQVGHAGGGIPGVVAAANDGDGGFRVAAVREIGVVVAAAVVVKSGDGGGSRGGRGGGGGIVEVVVRGGNDENCGLGKARGHQISQCHPNRKPSSVAIVHGIIIGKVLRKEGTLGFRSVRDMKMKIKVKVKVMMMAMVMVMVLALMMVGMGMVMMMMMKGAHRTVAAGTVSP